MIRKLQSFQKILMAAAVLILLLLVLITPLLLGQEDISSFPKLVLSTSGSNLYFYVTSWSGGTVFYRDIALNLTDVSGGLVFNSRYGAPAWGLNATANLSAHQDFLINVTVHDRRAAAYDFRGRLQATFDPGAGWSFILTSNADANPFRFTARDIAWPNQPFSVVFPRRVAG